MEEEGKRKQQQQQQLLQWGWGKGVRGQVRSQKNHHLGRQAFVLHTTLANRE